MMGVTEILAGGVRLVRTQPKAVAIWGGLYLVASIALLAVFAPVFGDMMAMQPQAMAARAAGLPPPPPPAGFFGAILGINAVTLILFAAIFAAAVRAVALGGDDRFGFLRFGGDELRLIGLGVLLVIAFMFGIFGAMLLGGLLVAALYAAAGNAAFVAGFFLVFAFAVLTVWLQVRISLAGAFTVLRGRIVIGEAWRATRGRFWTLFGAYLVIWIGFLVVGFIFVAIMNPDMLTMYAGGLQRADAQAIVAQQQAMMANLFGPRFIVSALLGAIVNALAVAIAFGAVATAAIGLSERDRMTGEAT